MRIDDIDYVISWVDGQDLQHKAQRKLWLERERAQAKGRLPNKEEARLGFEKATKLRFQDNGELYYNIASVLSYAPFIRRIFIVTDGQAPALLHSFPQEGKCAADFIRLVSHDEIFAAGSALPNVRAARPCFNSRAIEAALWRIPNLAEHFIFSNDDFFLNAPAAAADFFCESSGAPRLRGRYKSGRIISLSNFCRSLPEKISAYQRLPGHSLSLWRGAQLAGARGRFLSVPHCPHPLRKSVFAAYFTQNPQVLNAQLSFRFRSAQQFNPVSLANHLELLHGGKAEPPPAVAYLDEIKSPRDYADFAEQVKKASALYGCIQDMGLYPAEYRTKLHSLLVKKFAAALPEAVKSRLLSALPPHSETA